MKYRIILSLALLVLFSTAQANKEIDKLSKKACKATQKSQFQKVYEYSQQMIRLDSNDYSGYMFEGIAYHGMDQYDAALKSYWEAFNRSDEGKSISLNNIGLVYYNLEYYDSAIFYLKKALDLNPDDLSIYSEIADAYFSLDSDSCVHYYKKVLEKKPNDGYSWQRIADFYYNIDKYKESLEFYDQAARYDRKNGDIYYYRAYSKFMTDDDAGAIADIKKAMALKTDDEHRYYFLGLYSLYNDNFKEAIAAFKKSLQILPDDADTYYHMAFSQYALDHNHEALASINKSMEMGYEDPDAYRIRGYILFELSDKKAACADWQFASENGVELAGELLNENCKSVISAVN